MVNGEFEITGTNYFKIKVLWSVSGGKLQITPMVYAGLYDGYSYFLNGEITLNGVAVHVFDSSRPTHRVYAKLKEYSDVTPALAPVDISGTSAVIGINITGYASGTSGSGWRVVGSETIDVFCSGARIWNGTAWQAARPILWDGSAWQPLTEHIKEVPA